MNRDEMYLSLGVSDKVLQFGEAVLDELKPRFAGIEEIAELNQAKVIGAMQKNRVNATHFAASTGYGYDDEGRDNLERVYASAFHTEAALVRPQITCGTHALAIALSANLLPGDVYKRQGSSRIQYFQRFAGILSRTECPHFSVFIHLRRISAYQGVIAHQQKRDLRAADGLRRIPDALFFSDEPVVPRPGHGIPAALRYFGRIGVVVERTADCGLTRKTVEHDDRLLAG